MPVSLRMRGGSLLMASSLHHRNSIIGYIRIAECRKMRTWSCYVSQNVHTILHETPYSHYLVSKWVVLITGEQVRLRQVKYSQISNAHAQNIMTSGVIITPRDSDYVLQWYKTVQEVIEHELLAVTYAINVHTTFHLFPFSHSVVIK